MEIGGIITSGALQGPGASQWHLGKRLLVEVIQKTGDGEGTIRINGHELAALLEISAQIGDKFWVKVGEAKEGSLLLIREPLTAKQGDLQGVSQQFQQLIERGLPLNQDILTTVQAFPTVASDLFNTLMEVIRGSMAEEFAANFQKTIPAWDGLSEENGAEKLVEYFKKLGINYEQRVRQMLKLDSAAKEFEKNSLKDTFKFKLLEAMQNQEGQDILDSEGSLAHLLEKITGQQLWFKTGALDSAYMLLYLPLLNQGRYMPAQLAIESARKGTKMDEQHCRVAIQVETQQLGEIGVDAFFNQDSLTFRVLTRNLPLMPQLLEEVMPETRAKFSKLGFTIVKIETGDLDQNLEFQNFLRGIRRSGVDIQR